MRKSEMTAQQRQERELFKQKLINAKWNSNDGWNLLFEQDNRLSPEGVAEIESASSSLRLSYYIEKGYVLLECMSQAGSKAISNSHLALNLRFYTQGIANDGGASCPPVRQNSVMDNLTAILDKIIAQQDILSPSHVANFIKEVLTLSTPLVVETPQGLFQLSRTDE